MKKIFSVIIALSTACAVFAQGYYMEFKVSSEGSASVSGTMKTYAQDGNSRNEINFGGGASANPMINMNLVMIYLKSEPNKSYSLNVDDKTYMEYDLTQREDLKDYMQEDYQVTVVGKEKANGYNCTHVKVLNKKNNKEQDLWTSTEVTGYSDLMNIRTKYTGHDNLNKALAAKGASGFPVRMKVAEHNQNVVIDLVKAEKRANPSSLFSLDGYTKASGPKASPGSKNMQEMMQKIQNMTPEEREKYIEDMKKQYGNPK